MARADVFIRAGNNNRDTSIGGRGAKSTSGYAVLNTDNAGKSDCGLTARVEVVGDRGGNVRKTCDCGHKFDDSYTTRKCPKCGRQRQGIDTRKSVFTIELPDQQDEHCEVHIVEHDFRMAQLAKIGVALCCVKGVEEIAHGETKGKPELVKQGKMTIKFALGILGEMEEEAGKTLPHVELPGGVTLAHAMACVEVCRRMAEGQRSKN